MPAARSERFGVVVFKVFASRLLRRIFMRLHEIFQLLALCFEYISAPIAASKVVDLFLGVFCLLGCLGKILLFVVVQAAQYLFQFPLICALVLLKLLTALSHPFYSICIRGGIPALAPCLVSGYADQSKPAAHGRRPAQVKAPLAEALSGAQQ